MQSPREAVGGVLRITPRELRALRLLANDDTRNEVAASLGISTFEAEALLARLFAAMGAANQTDAVASARRRGLLTVEPTMASLHPLD